MIFFLRKWFDLFPGDDGYGKYPGNFQQQPSHSRQQQYFNSPPQQWNNNGPQSWDPYSQYINEKSFDWFVAFSIILGRQIGVGTTIINSSSSSSKTITTVIIIITDPIPVNTTVNNNLICILPIPVGVDFFVFSFESMISLLGWAPSYRWSARQTFFYLQAKEWQTLLFSFSFYGRIQYIEQNFFHFVMYSVQMTLLFFYFLVLSHWTRSHSSNLKCLFFVDWYLSSFRYIIQRFLWLVLSNHKTICTMTGEKKFNDVVENKN